ncbi:MAG: DNA (cytosine-5-)-methyltransferase [Salinicola sp.]|nr:DNA (cytosine-5-)-methyltransferase [Salinicola sp.]
MKPIQIVDLFAGPGGLGEGFNSIRMSDGSRAFQTLISVEKEPSAHRTLTLRAFYRLLRDSELGMSTYYSYLQGGTHPSENESTQHLWEQARQEALCLTLGSEDGNEILEKRLGEELDTEQDWVLIGGPPCQAYSLAGRSRNRGNKDYRPEKDDRHFLYKEYLNIIARFQPSIFVMENVKGILTSKVGRDRIFGQILSDLRDPAAATGIQGTEFSSYAKDGYTIFSLENSDVYYPDGGTLFESSPLAEDKYGAFTIRAERHGIPQARHRVILVGVRNNIVQDLGAPTLADILKIPKAGLDEQVTAADVLAELPMLRSGLSRQQDSDEAWCDIIKHLATRIADELTVHSSEHVKATDRKLIVEELRRISNKPAMELKRKPSSESVIRLIRPTNRLGKWYHGSQAPNKKGPWYNHETRAHMEQDLARYLYCASFAKVTGRAPKGSQEIYLDSLTPSHANWKSGKFADRFSVILENQPSKTITSHISKDGHYFIHYDPSQCRSLTVREAARLQTFPDDYYFEGNRTQQYVQVGNAVPPLLARLIANQVASALELIRKNHDQDISRISSI